MQHGGTIFPKTGDTKETEINNTQIPPPVIRKRAVLRIISSFLFLFFVLFGYFFSFRRPYCMRIPSTLLPLFLQPVQLPVLKQLVRCIHTKARGFPFLLFSDRETEKSVKMDIRVKK
jgi:hypothetical protein